MVRPRQDFLEKATELLRSTVLVDGHIDFPWRLSLMGYVPEGKFLDIPLEGKGGEFDFSRAKAGGLSAPFMAIYVAASFQDDLVAAKEEALRLIGIVESMLEAHPDKFASGLTPIQITQNFADHLISLPLGLENGAPIAQADDVALFFQKGIRYVTLTHAKDNHICDSSYDTSRTWKGVSPFGKELLEVMNDTGMIIDVSHISDDAFYQVMDISNVPVLATHSSCRAFTPGWERNMSDDMIKGLADQGGVIMINFGSDFLDAKVAKVRASDRKKLKGILDAKQLTSTDEAAKPYVERFLSKHPPVYSTVEKVADHIDHVRQIAGIEAIGIGSDFDGLGDSLPTDLKDVSMYPNLFAELMARGYSDDDLVKIGSGNVFRVWNEVLSYGDIK